eukprot:SM000062S19965  [mRNA]  locus=s62:668399:670979:- [translate_table: standard]
MAPASRRRRERLGVPAAGDAQRGLAEAASGAGRGTARPSRGEEEPGKAAGSAGKKLRLAGKKEENGKRASGDGARRTAVVATATTATTAGSGAAGAAEAGGALPSTGPAAAGTAAPGGRGGGCGDIDSIFELAKRRRSSSSTTASTSGPLPTASEGREGPRVRLGEKAKPSSSSSPTASRTAASQRAHQKVPPSGAGAGTAGRRRTADGLPIYREEELRLGSRAADAGGTELCPFDCNWKERATLSGRPYLLAHRPEHSKRKFSTPLFGGVVLAAVLATPSCISEERGEGRPSIYTENLLAEVAAITLKGAIGGHGYPFVTACVLESLQSGNWEAFQSVDAERKIPKAVIAPAAPTRARARGGRGPAHLQDALAGDNLHAKCTHKTKHGSAAKPDIEAATATTISSDLARLLVHHGPDASCMPQGRGIVGR